MNTIRCSLATIAVCFISTAAAQQSPRAPTAVDPLPPFTCEKCSSDEQKHFVAIYDKLRLAHDAALSRTLEMIAAKRASLSLPASAASAAKEPPSWKKSTFDVGVGAERNRADRNTTRERELQQAERNYDRARESGNIRETARREKELLDHMDKSPTGH